MTDMIHDTLFGPAGLARSVPAANDWRELVARIADDCFDRASPEVIGRWTMDLNGFASTEDIKTLSREDGIEHLRFLLDALSEYSGLIEVAARQSLAMGVLLGAAIAQTVPETLAEYEDWPERAALRSGLRALVASADDIATWT